MLDKDSRIRKNKDYQRIFQKSRWISGRWVTLHYRSGEGKRSRWGIVVSRRVGNAVVRNRVRRKIRVICAALDLRLTRKIDLIIVGKKGIDKADFWDLKADLEQICRRAQLIRERGKVEPEKKGTEHGK
ncbi:MAG: ribonuclease P protein component [Syntrophomonadaceae bacterium]|nr:ribonuclease P protein component [Syntrophomonadaceae bacterium]